MRTILAAAIAVCVCTFAFAPSWASPCEMTNYGRVICMGGAPSTTLSQIKHGRARLVHTLARVRNSALVRSINAKLARWVHPTHKCGLGETEELTTFYWQGRRTANGERFYPNGLTAAHLRLPFGTRVHVTNPHNGRSVTVRINDRGPATHATYDLSRGAARALGMVQSSYLCMSVSHAWADAN